MEDDVAFFAYKEKEKTTKAEEALPTSIKDKETHWLRRAVSLLHQKATKKEKLMGIWRITGVTWLQNLAVKSITILARLQVTSLWAY
eukprot:1146848-Pelagomonas_calceolata.AAC.3